MSDIQNLGEPDTGQPATPYDFAGYNRRVLSRVAGEVKCQRCGVRWVVRRCWIDKPSEQCVAVFVQHQKRCAVKNAVPDVGTA